MNILFLTSRYPYPPNRGDKVRTYQFLKAFSRNNSVYLFSIVENKDDYFDDLEKHCCDIKIVKLSKIKSLLNLVINIFRKKPFQVAYYNSRKGKKELNQFVKKYNIDLVYTHLIRMAPYSMQISCPKILDYTDAISMEYKRSLPFLKNPLKKLFFTIEYYRTANYEKQIHKYFDETWFISSTDLKYLQLNNDKVKILPNPVQINDPKKDFNLKKCMTFVGNLSVPHNINAVEFIYNEIMPVISERYPNFIFKIIGADSTDKILAMDGLRNTQVLGYVENLWQTLRDSDFFIAPMFFSAGVQNKVIEAMSVELPVLTTKNVADSITAISDVHMLVAQDADDFIRKIERYISDYNLRVNIGKSGCQKIYDMYSEEVVLRLIESRLLHLSQQGKY